MGFFSLKDSGIIIDMTCGSSIPEWKKNSITLSKDALSLMPGWTMGWMSRTSPRALEDSTLSRASIHPRLPRMVLISPLCAIILNGWASDHAGKVLVLKREWISARPEVKNGLERSG